MSTPPPPRCLHCGCDPTSPPKATPAMKKLLEEIQEWKTVGELWKISGIGYGTVVNYLRRLLAMGLVESRTQEPYKKRKEWRAKKE